MFSKSGALIDDDIDSSTDVLINIITFVIVGIFPNPPIKHSLGHRRAENVATVSLSFIIFFAGTQLIISSVSNLISNEQHVVPSVITVIGTLISSVGKICLRGVYR